MHDIPAIRPDQRLTDVHTLAGLVGHPPESTRIACRVLFAGLATPNSDLGSALVQASAESGAEPRRIIAMLQLLAADFGRPLTDEPKDWSERVRDLGQDMGETVSTRAERLFTDARARLGDIDLADAKRQLSATAEAGLALGKSALETTGETLRRVRERIKKD
jgi:hypothetical protein